MKKSVSSVCSIAQYGIKQRKEPCPVAASVVGVKDKAVEVRLQILLRYFLVCPSDGAFDMRPEVLSAIHVRVPSDVLAPRVIHGMSLVREGNAIELV